MGKNFIMERETFYILHSFRNYIIFIFIRYLAEISAIMQQCPRDSRLGNWINFNLSSERVSRRFTPRLRHERIQLQLRELSSVSSVKGLYYEREVVVFFALSVSSYEAF